MWRRKYWEPANIRMIFTLTECIIEVIKGGDISKEAYTGDGEMVNSDFLNGYAKKKDSIERMLEELEKKGIGKAGVQYKMKDWAFNRQRYWGEPIPIVHCPKCGDVAVPYEELPLRLPKIKDFQPGEDGQSPLAKIDSFVNCKCPKCGGYMVMKGSKIVCADEQCGYVTEKKEKNQE